MQFTDKSVDGGQILERFLLVVMPVLNSIISDNYGNWKMNQEENYTVISTAQYGAWNKVDEHDLFIDGIKLKLS